LVLEALSVHVAIERVTETQARIARQAYRDFTKTSGHPAKLNFGDCFSYALAKSKGEPLLFKGQDFSRTDVKSARAWVPWLMKLGKNGNVPSV
jgi:ribonuclease VapC